MKEAARFFKVLALAAFREVREELLRHICSFIEYELVGPHSEGSNRLT